MRPPRRMASLRAAAIALIKSFVDAVNRLPARALRKLGTAIANLGWDEVRFPAPVFVGDTLRVETEVIDLRDSKSRPEAGIVTFAHRAYNQNGTLVASCKRSGLQRRKPV